MDAGELMLCYQYTSLPDPHNRAITEQIKVVEICSVFYDTVLKRKIERYDHKIFNITRNIECVVFEKFTKNDSGRGGDSTVGPRISLRKSETMGVNNPATQKFFSTKDNVELFHDKENQKIGLRPVDEKTDDSYQVKKSDKEGHGAQINCRAFLREYELIPEKTTRYNAEWNDARELVIINLNDPDNIYGDNK